MNSNAIALTRKPGPTTITPTFVVTFHCSPFGPAVDCIETLIRTAAQEAAAQITVPWDISYTADRVRDGVALTLKCACSPSFVERLQIGLATLAHRFIITIDGQPLTTLKGCV